MSSVFEQEKEKLKTTKYTFKMLALGQIGKKLGEIPFNLGEDIPKEALRRFLKSKSVVYKGTNSIYTYAKGLLPSGQDGAIRGLMRFNWIMHKTSSELLEWAERDKKDLEVALTELEEYIIDNYDNPESKLRVHFPLGTAKTIAKAVRGFFRDNGFELSKGIFKTLLKYSFGEEKGYTPSKEEIKEAWSHANERLKLIIQFLINIPVRRDELLSLTWNDLDLETQNPIFHLPPSRMKGKGRGKYQGHFAIVMCENLRRALIKRKEEEKERFKTYDLKWSEDVRVFLSSDVTDLGNGKYEIAPLSYPQLGTLFNRLERITKIPISSKSFRNYAEAVVKKVYAQDHPMLELIIGHKELGTRAKYGEVWKDRKQMLEWFRPLEPHLDLFCEEQKKEDIFKDTFRKAMAQGKSPEEASMIALEEYKQYLLRDFKAMEEVLKSEVARASKEYEKRYQK